MKCCNRIRTVVSYCASAQWGLPVINARRSFHVAQTAIKHDNLSYFTQRYLPSLAGDIIFTGVKISQKAVEGFLMMSLYLINVGERKTHLLGHCWFVKTLF